MTFLSQSRNIFILTIILFKIVVLLILPTTTTHMVTSINNKQDENGPFKRNDSTDTNETYWRKLNDTDMNKNGKEITKYEQLTTSPLITINMANSSMLQLSQNESGNVEPNKSTTYYLRGVTQSFIQISTLIENESTKTSENNTLVTKGNIQVISVNTTDAPTTTMFISFQNITDDLIKLRYTTTESNYPIESSSPEKFESTTDKNMSTAISNGSYTTKIDLFQEDFHAKQPAYINNATEKPLPNTPISNFEDSYNGSDFEGLKVPISWPSKISNTTGVDSTSTDEGSAVLSRTPLLTQKDMEVTTVSAKLPSTYTSNTQVNNIVTSATPALQDIDPNSSPSTPKTIKVTNDTNLGQSSNSTTQVQNSFHQKTRTKSPKTVSTILPNKTSMLNFTLMGNSTLIGARITTIRPSSHFYRTVNTSIPTIDTVKLDSVHFGAANAPNATTDAERLSISPPVEQTAVESSTHSSTNEMETIGSSTKYNTSTNNHFQLKISGRTKSILLSPNIEEFKHFSTQQLYTTTSKTVTSTTKVTSTMVCTEPACITAADDIRSTLGKNPCIDPQKFVCGDVNGQYHEIPSDQSSWGFTEKKKQEYLERVKRLMLSSTMQNWKLLKAARNVYGGCMDIEKIEENGRGIWKSITDNLGGLPIAQEFWRKSAYDWVITSSKISRQFDKGSLIQVTFDGDNPNQIHINLGGSQLPISELLNYNKKPPVLQSWIDLFYKTMEELWFDEADKNNVDKVLNKPEEKSNVLKPAKLVAANNSNIDVQMITNEENAKLISEKRLNAHNSDLNLSSARALSMQLNGMTKQKTLSENTTKASSDVAATGFVSKNKTKFDGAMPPRATKELTKMDTGNSGTDILSRSKRSFLWMFPNKKDGSKVPDRNYFDIQVNETINLEIQIASLIDHFLQKQTSMLSFSQLISETKAPLAKDFARLDFTKLLNNIFQDSDIPFDPEKYTYVVRPMQMKELQILLSSYQPRDIANVLSWRTLQQVLDHMPFQFRTFKFEFDQMRYQVEHIRDRSLLCAETISKYFPAVVGHVIYDNIESRRILHFTKKLNHKIRHNLKTNLQTENIELPYFSTDVEDPDWLLDHHIVDSLYVNLNITNLSTQRHLSNIITLSTWKIKHKFGQIIRKAKENAGLGAIGAKKLIEFDTHPMFELPNGLLSNDLLQYPLLDLTLPYSINFGGVGFLMFQQAMEDIDQINQINGTTSSLTRFLNLFNKTSSANNDNGSGFAQRLLPTLEDFTEVQTMLIWLIKTWMCGAERENLVQPTEMHTHRKKLLFEILSLFKAHFKCDSFIFRDRPQFNIGHFLHKETT